MNPYDVVETFENEMAEWTGAPHAVAVDSGSAAIFLAILHERKKMGDRYAGDIPVVEVPSHTFESVPAAVLNAGCRLRFKNINWKGHYILYPLNVVDSACDLRKHMYDDLQGLHVCLSFQSRKHLSIGRGGMILTDDKNAAYWFKAMRWFGRSPNTGKPVCCGWNFKMEPDRAARGLELMQYLDPIARPLEFSYQDLSEFECYAH